MKREVLSIEESLVEMELSKIVDKYKKEGFTFIREKLSKNYVFDLFAENKKTGEKIVFEVKSEKHISKRIIQEMYKRKEFLKLEFPGVKFILVVARKSEPSFIKPSALNKLLLSYIIQNKKIIAQIKRIIPEFLEKANCVVSDVELSKIDFNDFKDINMIGYGTFMFWSYLSNEEFEGKSFSDGLPFRFNINLTYTGQFPFGYQITNNSKIEFDFSEFQRD
ncbi:MAG: hypothetical protein JZU47_07750 [Prolixibacteraceae bacterium]|nr:hypothetical protein [Prolixibacteraceae bacterium]